MKNKVIPVGVSISIMASLNPHSLPVNKQIRQPRRPWQKPELRFQAYLCMFIADWIVSTWGLTTPSGDTKQFSIKKLETSFTASLYLNFILDDIFFSRLPCLQSSKEFL
jgi:hypothetical protein